jgi:hypothetical protein
MHEATDLGGEHGPFATARISLGESSVVECVRTLRADVVVVINR